MQPQRGFSILRKLRLPGRKRSDPKLSEKDLEYVDEKGLEDLELIARKYIEIFLLDKDRDVPNRGNPLFKAFHGANVESLEQLRRSHNVKKDQVENFLDEIADLLVRWVVREYNLREQDEKRRKGLRRF